MSSLGPTIERLSDGQNLSAAESRALLATIMDGEASPAQIGGILTALRAKGETVEEIVGAAQAMRERFLAVHPRRRPLLDTCGTGGDGTGTFNISTTVAFVAAGAGVAVAKHGNRSISSRCGSADVLEALGARVDVDAEKAAAAVDTVGIGFLFAPAHHPAMRHAMGPRRELGMRTIFNLLGPLTNPAGATRQLLGVYSARWVEPLARVLAALGSERAVVVCGARGLDEAGLEGENQLALLADGRVELRRLSAADLGLRCAPHAALRGGDAEENAGILRAVLAGEQGARRDAVLLNAGLALLAAGEVELPAGVQRAAEALDSGKALAVLEHFIAFTQDGS